VCSYRFFLRPMQGLCLATTQSLTFLLHPTPAYSVSNVVPTLSPTSLGMNSVLAGASVTPSLAALCILLLPPLPFPACWCSWVICPPCLLHVLALPSTLLLLLVAVAGGGFHPALSAPTAATALAPGLLLLLLLSPCCCLLLPPHSSSCCCCYSHCPPAATATAPLLLQPRPPSCYC
jgi:hypothetical protein